MDIAICPVTLDFSMTVLIDISVAAYENITLVRLSKH